MPVYLIASFCASAVRETHTEEITSHMHPVLTVPSDVIGEGAQEARLCYLSAAFQWTVPFLATMNFTASSGGELQNISCGIIEKFIFILFGKCMCET